MKSLHNYILEAKTKNIKLNDKFIYHVGNAPFDGECMGFYNWGYYFRGMERKDKPIRDMYKELTGEKKFDDYISDKKMSDLFPFIKFKGTKELIKSIRWKIETKKVNNIGVDYIAATVSEIEIPSTDSGLKKCYESGELHDIICNKLEEINISEKKYKLNDIPGKIRIYVSYSNERENFRRIGVDIKFESKYIPSINICPLTFFHKIHFNN